MKPFLLIEGIELVESYAELDGEYVNQPCLRVPSPYTTHERDANLDISLIEILYDHLYHFAGKKNVTFVYHVTSEPKTLEECQNNLACITLGLPSASWNHVYSDMTGYLWTDFSIKARELNTEMNHDIRKELNTHLHTAHKKGEKIYLTLEIRAH